MATSFSSRKLSSLFFFAMLVGTGGSAGFAADCNGNGEDDALDIELGTSSDDRTYCVPRSDGYRWRTTPRLSGTFHFRA